MVLARPPPGANQPVVAASLSTRIPVSHFYVLAGATAAPLLFPEISTATVPYSQPGCALGRLLFHAHFTELLRPRRGTAFQRKVLTTTRTPTPPLLPHPLPAAPTAHCFLHGRRPRHARKSHTMSVLPAEVHTALANLLRGLQSPDNVQRTAAEQQLNEEWVAQRPEVLLMGLSEQIELAQETAVRRGRPHQLHPGC